MFTDECGICSSFDLKFDKLTKAQAYSVEDYIAYIKRADPDYENDKILICRVGKIMDDYHVHIRSADYRNANIDSEEDCISKLKEAIKAGNDLRYQITNIINGVSN